MLNFRVFDASAAGHRLALCDSNGKYHFVTAPSERPSVDSLLEGADARPGISVLRSPRTGLGYRLIFVEVDCGLAGALRRLND
jgi:hypothetical protein